MSTAFEQLIGRPAWMADANCRGMDTEMFHAERGDAATVQAAKAICRACDVQAECLAYAITNGETFGIWGGKSRKERLAIARRAGFSTKAVRPPAECGTLGGHSRHRDNGEKPCDECRQAFNRYQNERNAARRAARSSARPRRSTPSPKPSWPASAPAAPPPSATPTRSIRMKTPLIFLDAETTAYGLNVLGGER